MTVILRAPLPYFSVPPCKISRSGFEQPAPRRGARASAVNSAAGTPPTERAGCAERGAPARLAADGRSGVHIFSREPTRSRHGSPCLSAGDATQQWCTGNRAAGCLGAPCMGRGGARVGRGIAGRARGPNRTAAGPRCPRASAALRLRPGPRPPGPRMAGGTRLALGNVLPRARAFLQLLRGTSVGTKGRGPLGRPRCDSCLVAHQLRGGGAAASWHQRRARS